MRDPNSQMLHWRATSRHLRPPSCWYNRKKWFGNLADFGNAPSQAMIFDSSDCPVKKFDTCQKYCFVIDFCTNQDSSQCFKNNFEPRQFWPHNSIQSSPKTRKTLLIWIKRRRTSPRRSLSRIWDRSNLGGYFLRIGPFFHPGSWSNQWKVMVPSFLPL